MDNILDPRQEKYLNWLMQPVGYRVPTSQEKYAAEEGVDETTLRRWKRSQPSNLNGNAESENYNNPPNEPKKS